MKSLHMIALLAGAVTGGCGVLDVPPPRTPSLEAPPVDDPRSTPVPNARGRVVLDAVDEHAQVSRVVSRTEPVPGSYVMTWGHHSVVMGATVQKELLCVTPCTLDLPLGLHELVFSSSGEERNASGAFVTVSGGKPMVVRHAIGYDRPYSGAYMGGAISLALGVGLTLIGGLVLTVAGLVEPRPGALDNRGTFMAMGGVIGGLGLTLDVVGIVGLVTGRARHRDGATVTFPFEAAPR